MLSRRRFELIWADQARYPAATMYRLFGLSKNGHYGWHDSLVSRRSSSDEVLTEKIGAVYELSRETCGHRRIASKLAGERGEHVDANKRPRLMKNVQDPGCVQA